MCGRVSPRGSLGWDRVWTGRPDPSEAYPSNRDRLHVRSRTYDPTIFASQQGLPILRRCQLDYLANIPHPISAAMCGRPPTWLWYPNT